MTLHLKMDDRDDRYRLDDMVQGLVGTPTDRPEGKLKVSGKASYAMDVLPDDVCHGVLVRATITHGKLRDLDTEAVRALPGIRTVITGKRMLRNPAQGMAGKAPVQGSDDIAYFGQPVALVVADTLEQARHGALALRLTLEAKGDAVVNPHDPDASVEMPKKEQVLIGDLDEAMKKAAFSVDQHYTTPGHSSAAMEPHASVAHWHGDSVTLRGSYQMLAYNKAELADALGISEKNVRILAPYVGGGFGAKLGISPEAVAAALASKELGVPVAVSMTRQQVFETTMRRSETNQRIRLAADENGLLTGIGHEALVSNLPGEDFSEPVTQATPFLYRGENREIVHKIARIHRTCAGSVRAPGEAVGLTVLEIAMDELAEKAGIDPVELRKKNIPDQDPTDQIPFSSHALAEALDEGARRFGWDKRNPKPRSTRDGEWFVGMGMASAVRVNMLIESKARVTLSADGRAMIETDMTDIGTGTYAILGQIAGEMLGLPMEDVETRLGDTEFPPASGSGGSFGAASNGTAVLLGCEEIRRQLCKKLNCEDADMTLKGGYAIVGNKRIALRDVLDGDTLVGEGHVQPGKAEKKVRQATYGSYFAEVGVNSVTGETRLRRMLGVFAAGRILNAKTARSQCLGGMTFGIGMALTEELIHDRRDGHMVNHDFAEYHLPVNADVPQIEVVLLEERDEWANPLQAKGIGELGICGAAGSIVNAIYNACGVRVRQLPATLDKVIDGLDEAT
ncbi:xanthine dehydrogenase family protein molybdopterin-binding subunit [Oryzicola mucosus]|uniref:Xanthine dehydrogenase family protein molybdopterin-binding subunit n=1 Tax=Oryzicola mucosus TaxID=2767425 RepID=A0A8J6U061_9HYPH|nr:xanthine dehydrogenase family protein molybdopterin-binding subunit [Oryzicola mucosus]MBD0415151.1 xanthine dehydrogenase family protein molybdopterin-binding subunit [Oryzicola mucosus]